MNLQTVQAETEAVVARLTECAARCRGLGSRADALVRTLAVATADAGTLTRESRQPSRLGFIGAFTTGKTRLIETLLGCAGRLEKLVDEKPTSGNIVEFELRVGSVPQTQIDERKVVFMAEATDAARILRRLLLEARNEQNREKLTRLDPLLYDAEFEESMPPRWVKVQEWAKAAHAEAKGRQLKTIAFEVYRLAYTVNHAGDWVGREFVLSDDASALALLTLSEDRLHHDRPLSEWKVQVPKAPRGDLLTGLSPDDLRALFAVVRKVHFRVTLPPFVAESYGSPDTLDARVIDCPGADADDSNFRDSVLCAHELQEVDTVVVLTNAQRPGQKRAFLDDLLRIWGAHAKSRILMAISRFDLLPPFVKSPEVLEELASGAGPLTAEAFLGLESMTSFKHSYGAALDTVLDHDPNRVAAVCTLSYLTERLLNERLPQRGTPTFYKQELRYAPADANAIDASLQAQLQLPWVRVMEAWTRVAKRLELSPDRDSQDLSGLLADFGNDGGVGRLHRILQDHLARHATSHLTARLALNLADLRRRADEIEAELNKIPAPATAVPPLPGAPAATLGAGDALLEVNGRFQTFASQVENIERFPLIRRPPGAAQTEPILPPIRQWLIAEIHRWDAWRLLLNRVKREPAGLVTLVDRDDPALKLRERTEERNDLMRTPIKSDDFLPLFQETLGNVRDVLVERCSDVMRYHSEQLKRNLDAQLGATRIPQLAPALGTFGEDVQNVLKPLHTCIPETWSMAAFPGSATPATSPPAPDADGKAAPLDAADPTRYVSFFPLQHGDGKPLYYVWHKPLYDKYRADFDDRQRHLMYVIKLRQVLVTAALAWLERACHDLEELLKSRIVNHVKGLHTTLAAEVKKHAPKRRGRSGPAS